jgi:hypothetical protein
MKDTFSGRPPLASFHRVSDETQAHLLMDPTVARFFRPFLARNATVGEAATEAGCSPSTMLYRVRTFVRAGLLRVVEERPRAGRPIKVYRSAHDAYLIPYALTPFATLEEAFYASYASTARAIARSMARQAAGRSWDGYRLFRNTYGDTWLEGAPDATQAPRLDDPQRGIAFDFTLDAHLTPDEARALQTELHAYLTRYAPYGSPDARPGTKPYLFSVVFVAADEPTSS